MAQSNPLPKALSLAVHEFRTPVTVAAGYLRMLLKEQGGPLTDKQRKMLEEAERACGRVSALVNEMSDLGRLEGRELALAKQEIDVNSLVAELAANMHEGSDRGVRIEARTADVPLIVTGDRTRISNAVGALMRAALRERGEPGVIMAHCSTANDGGSAWAILAIGEEPLIDALRQRQSGPFEFNEWHGGLGLALPVARRVIEAHGGALWSAIDGRSHAASALRLPLRE
jgi:two-component system cell cycle sensor histidine kinase PleC